MKSAPSHTPPTTHFRTTPHWAWALLGTAVLYAAIGWAALSLAIPPGHASPIYPSAGLALASVLIFGWRMLFGIALGAGVVTLGTVLHRGATGPLLWLLPCAVALGSAMQAGLGAWLVRRFIKQPLTLNEPRDIALFFGLGGVLACFISSSIGVGSLWFMEQWPWRQAFLSWWVWGTGDTLGVLIAAPVALSLLAYPRADWAPLRWSVGLTLCVATGLIALGARQINAWEKARTESAFSHDVAAVSARMAAQVQAPLHALEALHSVYVGSEEVLADEFAHVSALWLAMPMGLQATGWAESPARRRSAGDEQPMVLRFLEPNRPYKPGTLGGDLNTHGTARTAIAQAIRQGRPAATAAMAGIGAHSPAPGGHKAADTIMIFQALYRGHPSSPQARQESVQGVVFVSLHLPSVLASLAQDMPSYLHLCLLDTHPVGPPTRLAGPVGCEAHTTPLRQVKHMPLAGREWQLQVSAEPDQVPNTNTQGAMLFSLVGLFATAMLGALLITVTGRTRRIEGAVNERTGELRREITERERTEASLRESEQRFRNILNHVPIGVVYTDLEGCVQQVNPRFCQLTGYSEAELMRRRISDLWHPEERDSDAELTHQLIGGHIPMYRRQCRYVTRDARVVWVQTVVSLLREPTGEPSRIVGVVEDITEHLRLADAERAREVAEAANLAKSEFLSRMSHELRTPLNAMLGFAQLLELDENHPLPDAHKPWVAQIQNAGWHLLDMINDVLDLSRIESGTLHLMAQSLDLHDLLSGTIALVEGVAARREITVTQDVDPRAAHVVGDATRVKQILTNLLSNAVKYNIDGGRVHISTRLAAHDQVAISVTDTGLGMTPEQQDKLFQPFNRLGRERSAQEGTGIGLVISRRLVELMGGSLTVDSVAGEGSAFTISLPRATASAPLPSGHDTQPQALSSYHQRIVHYVEDNETNVEVMRGILANRPQVRLDVSITGLDGLAAIRAEQPDLVLLDMHLPDISGLELLRHLKADPATAPIPVVAVSADALASQIDEALHAGAMRYLTKPVNVAELLHLVDTVLDGTETRYG